MNCRQASELLSRYHDDELPQATAGEVAAHLAGCEHCRRQLEAIQAMSRLVRDAQATVPADLWQKIAERRESVPGAPPPRQRRFAWALAIAAALLVMAGLALRLRSQHGDHAQMQAVFARFFAEYQQAPEFANRIFLAEYAHQVPTDAEAQSALGGPSITRLPTLAGCKLRERHLLTMPCCRCVQSVYTRAAGPPLVVFEHTEPQPAWFGLHTTREIACQEGVLCRIEAEQATAITFKLASHYVTIFGANGVEEGRQIRREANAPG